MTGHQRQRDVTWWRPRMTIRARLTLTYTGLLAATGAILLTLVYFFMRFVPTYAISPTTDSSRPTGQALPTPGPTLAPTSTLPGPSGVATANGAGFVDLRLRNESDILNTLLIVSVIILVLLVVVGARVGWVIAGRVLRPLQAINRAAKVASTGSLDHRVGLAGPHDEIQDLSDTFDDMLGKLDGAFQAYQRFAANASHELRTPLATTQTILDVALADPELDVDDLRKVSERVREMNHRNIETVEALLKLAELDQTPLLRDEIDVSALLRSVVDRLAHEIDAERLHVTVPDAPHGVRGDPVLIRQLLVNLVQNAVRHNQPGGTVHVTVEDHAEAGEVLLRIVNTGDAVSPESIGSLVEPFFRTRGRTTQTRASHNGHGLGLAIVSAIVKAHDGRLTMEANPGGGLTVEVVLPR